MPRVPFKVGLTESNIITESAKSTLAKSLFNPSFITSVFSFLVSSGVNFKSFIACLIALVPLSRISLPNTVFSVSFPLPAVLGESCPDRSCIVLTPLFSTS